MNLFEKTIEKIKLFAQIIFVNKKYSIIAFLGLGISLGLTAQGFIFLYSYQYDAFNSYLTENPTEQITITPGNMISSLGREETLLTNLTQIMDNSFKESNLEQRVKFRTWFNRRAVFFPYEDRNSNNETKFFVNDLVGVEDRYLDILQSHLLMGQMPSNSNETLLLINPNWLESTNITLGEFEVMIIVSPFSLELSYNYGIPAAGRRINITGIIDTYQLQRSLNNTSEDSELLRNLYSVMENEQMLITSRESVIDFVAGLSSDFPYDVAYHRAAYVGTAIFNIREIDAFDLSTEINRFISFSENIRTTLELTDYTNEIHLDLELVNILQDFADEFAIFRVIVILFMAPTATMAFSLTAYSSNLVKKRRERQLSLLSQRGCSRREIISMLLIELTIFTLIAIGLAFLISYPLSYIIMQSDGFLSFQGPPVTPRFFAIVIEIVIIASFVVSLLINVGNIWKYADISKEEAFAQHKETKPFWERYYIDIFFIVIGLVSWLITASQLKNLNVSVVFARIIGAPAPILLLTGIVLFTSRIFPLLTDFLSKIFIKANHFQISSLSFRSLSRRRSSTLRSLILIMLTFTLAITSIIVPDTYRTFQYENGSYELGSDIVIFGVNDNDLEFKENIESIEGVKDTTYVNVLSPLPITRGSLTYSYQIIGINITEYPQVAFFEKEYLDQSLESTLEKLEQPLAINQSCNVLVQKDQIIPYDITEGETFDIIHSYLSGGTEKEKNYTVRAVEFYNYWPMIYKKKPSLSSTNIRLSIVTTISSIYNLTTDPSDIFTKLLIKVKDNYPISNVVKEVEDFTFGKRVDHLDNYLQISQGSLRSTVLYGSLNANFIASIVVLIFAMALFTITHAIERAMEVGIMKTLGISPLQLFNFFFTEALTIIFMGAIIGALMALLTSYMFMSLVTVGVLIPPWEMEYSLRKLILTVSIMLGVATLSSMIPGIFFASKREAEIMRQA
ncbi:MAG: FtsX-like permease family protein [Asgard group archaeon]|nr:FtsX-like permease family protein [Asgard group archaeon]